MAPYSLQNDRPKNGYVGNTQAQVCVVSQLKTFIFISIITRGRAI